MSTEIYVEIVNEVLKRDIAADIYEIEEQFNGTYLEHTFHRSKRRYQAFIHSIFYGYFDEPIENALDRNDQWIREFETLKNNLENEPEEEESSNPASEVKPSYSPFSPKMSLLSVPISPADVTIFEPESANIQDTDKVKDYGDAANDIMGKYAANFNQIIQSIVYGDKSEEPSLATTATITTVSEQNDIKTVKQELMEKIKAIKDIYVEEDKIKHDEPNETEDQSAEES